MALLESLFVWANLPYAVVFTVAILFAILQMTGVLGLLAGGSDHDADADADHDIDADADHDVDADADADADHDADGDGDGDHEHQGVGDKLLVDLGVGRVPFSILWQTFAVSFGITGLAINAIALGRSLATSSLAWTLPVSFVVAWFVTRSVSRLLGRVVGGAEAEATSRHGLIGQTGVVISSRITSEFGEIRAKDRAGHFVHVVCRIREGEEPIASGREVVIVDYDADAGRLFVAPLDEDSPAPRVDSKKRVASVTKDTKDVSADAAGEVEAAAEIEASSSESLAKTRNRRSD